MAEQPGNQRPNTPDVSETELRGTKAEELRDKARELDVSGASDMRKEELVRAIATAEQEGGGGRGGDQDEDGGVRTGPVTSTSLKYSQEITSTDDDPKRPGRSLVTTDHEVIRQWAERRDAVFATFEERRPNLSYQEERSDGAQSNFFRLENPAREDA